MSARDAAVISVEELLAAPQPPKRVPCHNCDHPYAGSHCPLCKTERPAYTAIKNISRRPA